MNRLPASQRYKRYDRRWKRYEKPLPGHRVQVDVKFIEPIAGSRKKHYQYTAIDDCTRIRVLRIYPRNNQKTAIQFIDYVLEKLPFQVEVIQTDNGAEFQGGFHWHVLDRGIRHVYIKPATPRLNGKVERSHRIDAEEFYRMLDGVVIDDTELFNDKLQEWEAFYMDSSLRTTTTKDTGHQGPRVNPDRQLQHLNWWARCAGRLRFDALAPAMAAPRGPPFPCSTVPLHNGLSARSRGFEGTRMKLASL